MSKGQHLLKAGNLLPGRRRPRFDTDWGKQKETRLRGLRWRMALELFKPGEKSADDVFPCWTIATCKFYSRAGGPQIVKHLNINLPALASTAS